MGCGERDWFRLAFQWKDGPASGRGYCPFKFKRQGLKFNSRGAREPRPPSDRTNRRKAWRQWRQPPSSWYSSSWRGLLFGAPPPESAGVGTPETTPTEFQALSRRHLRSRGQRLI